ncbi:hypothetical protein J2R98_002329 [Alkalibacillus filiformis]|uniref:Uncharacterized protein n=2 Tax=Alkalibacillus filiformis TaxID=200990 RepID=A0ABU0DVN1_9BACI|nr:hypothetical protein [Alkalibacillus filiformis]
MKGRDYMSKKNFEIAFQLGANMDPSVKKAFGQTQRNLKNFRQGLGNAAKMAGKFALGVAGAATAAAGVGVGMANRFSKTADEIDKASQRAGVHTDYLQEMRHAMDQVGVSESALEKALQRTNQRYGQAMQGNEKYTEALNTMNISLRDQEGNMRSTEDVFQEAIDYLGEMESSSERAALASEFFGEKTAQELMPALEKGGDEIKKLRDEAHDLGAVIGEDGIEAGVLWADTMDKVKKTFQGFFSTIAMKVLPTFQRFLDAGLDKLPAMQDKLQRALEIVGGVLSWLGDTGLSIFHSIRDAIRDNFNPTMNFRDLLSEAGDFLRNAFEMAQPHIEWFINEGIPKAIGLIADVVDRAKEVYQWIVENWSWIAPIVAGITAALVAFKAITLAVTAATKIATAAKIAWTTATCDVLSIYWTCFCSHKANF